MRYNPDAALESWKLLEIATQSRRVVSKEIAGAADKDFSNILSQLRLLRAAGCPPNRERGDPLIEKVGTYVVKTWKSSVTVYVLKCKPGLWRLYFIPDPENRRIVFLYATNDKKRGKRDPEDFSTCKGRIDRLADRRYIVHELDLSGL